MKKIYTLLTLGLLTAASASAVVAMPERVGEGMSVKLTPEAAAGVRASFDRLHADLQAGTVSPGTIKRTYQDRNGNIWDARFDLMDSPLCDQLVFTGENNEEVKFTFEEFPFYRVDYVLYQYDSTGERVGVISQVLSWPSKYYAQQIFDWTGEVDPDGYIPLEKRDFDPVSFDDMCNGFMLSTGVEQTRTFTESSLIWPEVNANNSAFISFTMLPTERLGIGSRYNGYDCYTTMENGVASSVKFEAWDAAEQTGKFENNIYLKVNNVNRAIRNTYEGDFMVNGFTEKTLEWTPGQIHLFNTGETGSDILEDNDYYPEFWGPLQRYLLWIPGEYMTIVEREPNKPNTDSNIGITWKDGVDQSNMSFNNVNYSFTALFSPVGVEPTEAMWRLILGEEVGVYPNNYYSIWPESYTFVQNGWNYEWSQNDGALLYYHQFPFIPVKESSIFFIGSTEGAGVRMTNDSYTTFYAASKEDIIYHYDPANISNTKKISAVGSMELPSSGVKEVLAESNMKVAARNGAISVTAGENGNVAVYSINGQLVKSVDAKAGQTVDVKAPKGLYIVKAGKKAVKVVL